MVGMSSMIVSEFYKIKRVHGNVYGDRPQSSFHASDDAREIHSAGSQTVLEQGAKFPDISKLMNKLHDDQYPKLKKDLEKVIKDDRLVTFKEALRSNEHMGYSDQHSNQDQTCLSVLETLEGLETFNEDNVDQLLRVACRRIDENDEHCWWKKIFDHLLRYKERKTIYIGKYYDIEHVHGDLISGGSQSASDVSDEAKKVQSIGSQTMLEEDAESPHGDRPMSEDPDERYRQLKADLQDVIKDDRLVEFKEALNADQHIDYSHERLSQNQSCESVLQSLEQIDAFNQSDVEKLLIVVNGKVNNNDQDCWWNKVYDLLFHYKMTYAPEEFEHATDEINLDLCEPGTEKPPSESAAQTDGEHSDDRFYHLKMDLKKLIKGDRLTEFKEALNAARQIEYNDENLGLDKSCLSVLKTLERLNTFSESNVDLLLHVANMNADEDEDNRWWTDVGDLLSSFKCGRHNN